MAEPILTEVSFNTQFGYTLRGTLTEPSNYSRLAHVKNVVILLHGLNCDRNSSFLPALSSFLAVNNLASLRFDFPGSGSSDGCWSYANYEQEAACIQDAVTFLQSQGFCVTGILGHSKAASELLIYACGDTCKNIRLIHVSGRFNLVESPAGRFSAEQLGELDRTGSFLWLGKRVTREAMDERNRVNMLDYLSKLDVKLVNILLVHCADDIVIPVEDARRIQQSRPDVFKDLLIIDKGGHSYNNQKAKKKLFDKVLEFLTI